MFLTREELQQLTGYKTAPSQARWLAQERLPFVKGGDGRLKVLREVVERRLGAPKKQPEREPQLRWSPNKAIK
ncbi:DUF4224 domain-containing protein [Pseudomonas sp. JI-2]|nr:DUF4224 domain-containing protein [Pseudomonas sp. JI-2]